jgi:UDP-2,3-diacylglucosamine pyrophosphatase LpxH
MAKTNSTPKLSPLEKRIKEMTQLEQQALLKQLQHREIKRKTYNHRFSQRRTRIGVISDTHIGHEKFDEELFLKALTFYKRNKAEAIYHVGDILEGMSGRPGHIYELSHVGFTSQLNYAADLLSQTELPIYAITGNHDQWYMKKGDAGVDVGDALEDKLKNFTYLGMNEADIELGKNTKMKLFHGSDGTAYAISYKMQKLIESFTESERPDIVLSGHYHKALQMFSRGTYGYECGTLCGQTEFMRGKKIPAHKGFWMLDIYHNKNGVERINSTFMGAD